ncbi:hypothetical protein CRG98_004286, partial [Punica granatum]
ASKVRRACSLVLLATLPGLLTRASLLSSFASSPSLLAHASCNLAGSAHPCEFTLMLRKFADASRCSSSLLARASCNLTVSAHPCEFSCASSNLAGCAHSCKFTLLLRKFVVPARFCFLQPCRICSDVRVYFQALQDRQAWSLVLLATSPDLLTHASLLSFFPTSPCLLVRASCNLARTAQPFEFTFMLPKFAEPARSCFLQPRTDCSTVRIYFHASQVRRACSLLFLATTSALLNHESILSGFEIRRASSLVLLATLPGPLPHTSLLVFHVTLSSPLIRKSLLSCSASTPSLLDRASCNLARSAHPWEFIFMLPKFSERAISCFCRPCQACSLVRVYFHASQVRRACSLVPLANSPGQLTRASLLSCFPSSRSLLAPASCILAGCAHPCEFTFRLRKFAELARSCFLQSCRFCSAVRIYFHTSKVLRACLLVLLATLPCLLTRASLVVLLQTLPGLLTCASLLCCFVSSSSLLACASCNHAKSVQTCEFSFMHCKIAKPGRSCFLQPRPVCSPMRVCFHSSQLPEACSFVLLATSHGLLNLRRCFSLVLLGTLPGLLSHASLLSCFASSPSLLAHASCNLAGSAHLSEFIFILPKFAKPARSCFLQNCGAAHPCEFTLMLRKFADASRWCFLELCRVCSPMRVCYHASQVLQAFSLMLLATLPGLLTCPSLFSFFLSSPSLLARASFNLAHTVQPCEFALMLPKFIEPARSFLLQPRRICSPMRVYFYFSQLPGACLFLLPATSHGLLNRANLLSCFLRSPSLLARTSCNLAGSPSLLARASCKLTGSAHPCELTFIFPSSRSLLAPASCNLAGCAHPSEFTFRLRKVAELARSCFLKPRPIGSPVRVYFKASQVRRACSLVLLATLPSLFTRASLVVLLPTLLGQLTRASLLCCFTCEFTFILCKLAEPGRSCFLQPRPVCSPVRVYFQASQGRRACSLVLLAVLPALLSRTNLLSYFVSSSSLLIRAYCNIAESAHPCEFTFILCKLAEPGRSCFLQPRPSLLARASCNFAVSAHPCKFSCASSNLAGSAHTCQFTLLLRKFIEPARLCFLQPCRICSDVRVYFLALQDRQAWSLVLFVTSPGLLTRASLLSYFASSSSLLIRAYCNIAKSAHPCEFTFILPNFLEPARSCFLQPRTDCSTVRIYFHASQVRRACSLVLLATSHGLLNRANLLSCFPSSPSLLARPSCNLAGFAHPCEFSCASSNLAGSAHSCEFTLLLRKLVEPASLCFLQPCRICSGVRVYFHALQACRAWSVVLLETTPGLLTRASLLCCFAYEFTFMLCKLAEPGRSCFLKPHPVCSLVRVYFKASQVRRACSLVLLATLPSLFTCASLVVLLPTLPGLLTRASLLCCFAYEFTFMLCKLAEPGRSCFLKPHPVCSPLVLLTTMSDLFRRANLLSYFASSPSLVAHASCNLAWSAHPCEFTFRLHKFVELARSCFLQSCRFCSAMRIYFHTSKVLRVCSLVLLPTLPCLLTRASLVVLLPTLPGLLTRACLLCCFVSSSSLLACASCNHVGSVQTCEFTFCLCKIAKPGRSCFLQAPPVCSPVQVCFHTSQVRGACSLVLLATLSGLLNHESLLSYFVSSPSLLVRAYCNIAESAQPCEFTFILPNFPEPPRSCFLQPRTDCSTVRIYFHASQVRRAWSLVLLATSPGLLTRASLLSVFARSLSLVARASCNLAGSAHPCEFSCASSNLAGFANSCEFTLLLRKLVEPASLCFLKPCRICSGMRVYFNASQACEFTLTLRKFAELARSCFLQSCRFWLAVRIYFHTSKVLRACSLVLLAILSVLLCEFTFILRKFFEPARSCFLQSCRFWLAVRIYFHTSKVLRACSLVLLAILSVLVSCANLLSYFESSSSLLARASCNLAGSALLCEFSCASSNLAGSAQSCEFTLLLRKFVEPARFCFLQPCRICSDVRVYFHALQVRRAWSLVLLATSPGLLTRASLLSYFASSPSLLARVSCNLAGSAQPCKFTFILRKFAELARSCFLQHCRVRSPMRVYFHSSQLPRASSFVLLATVPGVLTRTSLLVFLVSLPSLLTPLPGLLTLASLFSCFPSSMGVLSRASANLAKSAHPCQFIFMLPKFAEPARLCFLQTRRVSSPVRVYFPASQVCRARSFLLLATSPGLLTCESILSGFVSSPSLLTRASCNLADSAQSCEFTFMFRKFAELASSCFLQPGRVAHPCEFTLMLCKFADASRWCFLEPCRVCSPMRVYYHASQVRRAFSPCFLQPRPDYSTVRIYFRASQVRRACSLVLLATLPGLLIHFAEPARSCFLQPCRVCSSILLSYFASSPSLLARASCNLAGSAHPFRRACSLVLLATLPGLLIHVSLLSYFASSPSLLARASCNLAGSAHPCKFTFILRKFAEPARSCFLQPCRVCSSISPSLLARASCNLAGSAHPFRRACSLVLLATLPGLLIHVSLLSYFASSPSLLARASCNLAGSAHPCKFTFILRKFAEPARSCFLQPCRVCSSILLSYFASSPSLLARASCNLAGSAHPFRRACSLVLLATLPGLLIHVSLLSYFASSPSLLARASCNLAGSAHPFRRCFSLVLLGTLPGLLTHASLLSRFASSPSLLAVLLATSPGLLNRANLLSYFASSPSLLARASCNKAGSAYPCEFSCASSKLAGSADPCEFTLMLCKFVDASRWCFLEPCRVCSPMRVYYHASQVRRACLLVLLVTKPVRRCFSLVLLGTLPGLLTHASLLSRFASSPSLLARASCNKAGSAYPCEFSCASSKLAGSADPCEFTLMLCKFVDASRWCFLEPCRVCSPMRVYYHASQVRRACLLVLLVTKPGLLTRASLVVLLANSPGRLTLRRCFSLVLLGTLPGLLTHASLLSRFASSPSLLARASCNKAGSAYPCEFSCASSKLAGSADPCEFTLMLCKFVDASRWCFLEPCRVCSPMRVYYHASQVRRACLLVLLVTKPGLLTRASLVVLLANSPGRLTLRRCFSLVLLGTLPGLLTHASLLSRFASSPSLLARASCNKAGSAYPCEFSCASSKLAGSADPCEFTLMLCKFVDASRWCFLEPCRVCSPMRVYYHASQVRRACLLVLLVTKPGLLTRASLVVLLANSPGRLTLRRCFSLVLLGTLPGLLTHASLLSRFASSPSLLARASCNKAGSAYPCEFSCASSKLAGSADPCEFTLMLCKFVDASRWCFLEPCRVCSLVRVYFQASQGRRACSLLLLATSLGQLSRASLLSCFASSPSLLAHASCNLVGLLTHASLRSFFQLPGAGSFLLLATSHGLHNRTNLLSCFLGSSSLLARASCNFVGSAHSYEFTCV